MDEPEQSPFKRAVARFSGRGLFDKVVFPAALATGVVSLADHRVDITSLFVGISRWLSNLFSSTANASNASTTTAGASEFSLTPYLPATCIVGVFLVLLGSFWFALFSGRAETETAKAWDLIKLICGFFIGTLTT